MFDVGQKVMVVTDKGVAYDATILAKAKGDHGPGAYKVAIHSLGPEQLGQWHKAADVFVPEEHVEYEKEEISSYAFLKG
jgi:hypothetical protein